MNLLTLNASKLDKAQKFGFLNAALYLSPATLSGNNVCSHSTPGCERVCINVTGHGKMGLKLNDKPQDQVLLNDDVGTTPSWSTLKQAHFSGWNMVQRARFIRTGLLFSDREEFFKLLLKDLEVLKKAAKRKNLQPAVRLNGTSDLDWVNLAKSVNVDLQNEVSKHSLNVYEYTKVPNRRKQSPFHHTFSLSEHPKSEKWALEWLKDGHNVAIVFRHTLPMKYSLLGETFDVIDGDENDLRFRDPSGVIVGLKAKGWAKKDTTGFVK